MSAVRLVDIEFDRESLGIPVGVELEARDDVVH
jgi:hypothetical protein